jgi:RNA polymerase sigma factor (sigma-70 family)
MTAVAEAVAEAHENGWALVLAATVRVTRDLDLAEECVQEAYAAALERWPVAGIPASPVAWLTTVAKRRAIDTVRRERVLAAKLPLLTLDPDDARQETGPLALIFMCCHPALAAEAQPALTLRLVCGLPTAEIARAFLVSETTMAARLTRAKKKIAAARIPYRVPEAAELPARLRGVLGVVHLLFTAGHTAAAGASLLRTDLMERALHLARLLRELMPDEREVWGLLALLLVTHARRETRVDGAGRLVRLGDQDRSLWDRAAIDEGHQLIVDGLRGGRPGRYVLQAAIASLYARAPTFEQTDWPQLVTLYDALLSVWPSPVVALNRTVAVAEVHGPEQALAEVEALERDGQLAAYQYLPAVKADLLRRLGRTAEAATAYRQALERTGNEVEREYLSRSARCS